MLTLSLLLPNSFLDGKGRLVTGWYLEERLVWRSLNCLYLLNRLDTFCSSPSFSVKFVCAQQKKTVSYLLEYETDWKEVQY